MSDPFAVVGFIAFLAGCALVGVCIAILISLMRVYVGTGQRFFQFTLLQLLLLASIASLLFAVWRGISD